MVASGYTWKEIKYAYARQAILQTQSLRAAAKLIGVDDSTLYRFCSKNNIKMKNPRKHNKD